MIIHIASKNNNLLDLLFKNPNTDEGLYLNPLKNGVIAGNAVSKNHYEVVFQDSRYSYMPEESNAIDFQSYCSPLVVLDICNQLFSHTLKEKSIFLATPIKWLNKTQGEVDITPTSISIPTFYINSGWVREGNFLLSKYFKEVTVEHQVGYNYSLNIEGKNLFEAFNLLCLVSVFSHITNQYGKFTFIDDQFAIKYARILTNIENVPYFVLYLFIKRATKSDRQFELIKESFEKYLLKQNIKADLTYYGTHQERIKYITDQLDLQIPILDIGCGELLYYNKMKGKYFQDAYVAVDENSEILNIAEALSKRYNDERLEFHSNLNEVEKDLQYNILLTEVIEHNTEIEAGKLLQEALKFNFNKIILTTPNVEFNKYYSQEIDTRHDDHHFEFTRKEFQNFIEVNTAKNKNLEIEFFGLGDTLNGLQPTQGCIIKNKN